MDQNSSNDAEKRNWRERLGIGARDLPKIAGEFSKPAEPVLVMPAKGEPKSDPGHPVVVAKPAPMAPRVAAKPAPARPAPSGERPARPPQAAMPPAARPMQPASPQSPDVLAERLRNQREAAEKLAEQRVNNAKERAEANKAAQAQVQAQSQPPQAQPSAAGIVPPPPSGGQRPRAERGGSKPKFSFADDEMRSDAKRDPRPMPQLRPAAAAAPPPPARGPGASPAHQPQIAPARPPLGGQGDRFVAPQVPPPSRPVGPPPGAVGGSGFPPPPYRPQPPGAGYRPIDPATGYAPPPAFQMPRGAMAPPPGPRPAAMPGGMGGDPRLQTGPYIGDPYAPPLPPHGGIPRYDQLGRGAPPPPLRNDQLRPQTHSYEGDIHDDIFEDGPAKPVRRASPSDYSQAYHPDADMDYAPPRRRSGGPLLLLMLLGVAAAVGIGGVLYYQNMLKTGASASNDPPPVVAAPGGDVKTAAPDGSAAPAGQTTAQPSKKQIYDRIVGDREVLGGQMTPTEEPPVQPAIDQQAQPAAVAPATPGGATDEPLPLPMPPPVNTNTQGSNGSQALPVPAATAAAEPLPVPVPPGSDTQVTATGYSSEQQQQMAAASQQQTLTEEAPPPVDAAAPEEAAPPPAAKPAKPKAAAKAKPKKKTDTAAKDLGAAPVVLVPEQNAGDDAAITQDPSLGADEPPLQQGAAPVEQPVKKKKTLLGLFTGENKRAGSDTAPIDAATEQQQVASVNTRQNTVEAPPPPRAAAPAGAKSGFTLQLASFPTEQEARAEYQRVASRHSGQIGGLSPIISPVSVGGSTRYRLSLGTVSSSTQAQSICKDLASAGLRDCVVRRQQ